MKLILITVVEEFEQEVKKILKHSGVKSFSLHPVKGYKNNSEDNLHNWFGIDDIAINSLLFIVFAQQQSIEEIIEKVTLFNQHQDSQSQIHLVSIQTDKSI